MLLIEVDVVVGKGLCVTRSNKFHHPLSPVPGLGASAGRNSAAVIGSRSDLAVYDIPQEPKPTREAAGQGARISDIRHTLPLQC